ncbi:MAG: hypothetical protein NZM31_04395 [Gemmatales bacterium]|nr:hypothetical protein [Gemmatales bacterium]MDW8386241.1 hypothetical protein [Gemmatales bacterium]
MSTQEENPSKTQTQAESDAVGAGIDFTDPNSPLARYYLRSSHVALAIVLALIFVVVGYMRLWHTDVWAHAAYGRYIVENLRLPEHELLCDLAEQHLPYANYQWISQAIFYLTYRLGAWLAGGNELRSLAGGVEALRALFALLVTLRIGFLGAAILRMTDSGWLAVAGVVLATLLGLPNLSVLRPQGFGEVYFAILLFLLSGSAFSWRSVIATAILMTIWANSHGSYLIGLAVLGAAVVVAALGGLTGKVERASAARLAVAGILSVIGVALLNPHGPWLFLHTLDLAKHPNIADMDEWKPLDFATPWGVVFLASTGLLALTLAMHWLLRLLGRTGPIASFPLVLWSAKYTLYVPLLHWILLLLFAQQTLQHTRFTPWWVPFITWMLAWQWHTVFDLLGRPAVDRDVLSLRKTILAVLSVIVLLLWTAPATWLMNGSPAPVEKTMHEATPWRFFAELTHRTGEHYPALADWLRRYDPENKLPGRIFCTETQGDYLAWAGQGKLPIFMYTHVHLFSPRVWNDCQQVKMGSALWSDILDRYGVDIVLAEAELCPGLRQRLQQASDRWEIVVDETGDRRKRDRRGRILIAVRKLPADKANDAPQPE